MNKPHEHSSTRFACQNNTIYTALDVNILSLNVCGLKSKLVIKDFMKVIRKYDVVTLCETRCAIC